MATDNVVNSRSKHIDVRFQMIMDCIRKGMFEVKYVPTKDMVADIMNKPLPKETFSYLVKKKGMS